MVLGSVNLISYIYKGTISNTLKTHSLEIAREHSEALRARGFSSLPVTPDSCLPYPVTNLDYPSPCPSNPYPPEIITAGGRQMKIYKSVQYASEDETGNIAPLLQSQVISTHAKQITVIVSYRDNNIDKLTEITSLVSDREVPVSGSVISGRVVFSSSGSPSSARVSVINRPEYSASAASDGTYIIRNVMPGIFNLYAEGAEFIPGEYALNPLHVSDTASDYKNINITVTRIIPAVISGTLYFVDFDGLRGVTKTANGSVPGYVSGWLFPSHINSDNSNSARSSLHNAALYTSFSNAQRPNEEIVSVRLLVRHRSASAAPGNALNVQVFRRPPEVWASEKTAAPTNPWAGNASTVYESLAASTSYKTDSVDLTSLYPADQWTWDRANALNAVLRSYSSTGANPPSFGTFYIEYAAIVIESKSKKQPLSCAARVWSDRSTTGAVTSPGNSSYSINNINADISPVSACALCKKGSKTYYGSMTGVAVSAGTTTLQDIILSETKAGEAYITGKVLDNNDRLTGVPGVTVLLSQNPPLTAVTAADGTYIISGASTGHSFLSAEAGGYKSAGPPKSLFLSQGINEAPPVYVYETGRIGGRVTETGTDAPLHGVMVTAKPSLGAGFDRFSGSSGSDGYFVIEDVPAGSGYLLSAEPDSSVFTVESPSLKYHSNITVSKGAMTPNKNFKLKRVSGFISGTVSGPFEKNRVFISAHPLGFSGLLPHQFSLSSASADPKAESLRERRTAPHYGCVADETGAFILALPLGPSYSVYAYYTGVSLTAAGKTVIKRYTVKTGVIPGDEDVVIAGPWTDY